METKEFQKKCVEIVKEIDKKFNIERDPHLCFAQLIEEIGEVAKDINTPKLRNKEIDRNNLEGEFADVFVLLSALADLYDIDFEKAVEEKIKILKEKQYL
jgi:NTP pyrophosphatase (non-canonical NTP hydrolase)